MTTGAKLVSNPSVRVRNRAVILQNCDLLKPLPIQTLSRDFWIFLSASVFFDFGFGLFFFLFNLYLTNIHFDERAIGLFTSAFTAGSLTLTYPAGLLARRFGLRPLLAICVLVAPLMAAVRLFFMDPGLQLLLSFVSGAAMCGWAVCVPTALARLTDERNRSVGFSLNFAVGIGAGVLAGFAGGALPSILVQSFSLASVAQGMRLTLIIACIFVTIGSLPLIRYDFRALRAQDQWKERSSAGSNRFLIRFLLAFGLWSVVAGAFAPFANIFLERNLRIPLNQIGEIFAVSQFVQAVAVLSTPTLARFLGTQRTIPIIQLITATMLVGLGMTTSVGLSIAVFILLNAFQYMLGPSIYPLLMNNVADRSRSTASAAQSITSSVVAMAAVALAGVVISRWGYPVLFVWIAGCALAAAAAFALLLRRSEANASAEANHTIKSTYAAN